MKVIGLPMPRHEQVEAQGDTKVVDLEESRTGHKRPNDMD